MRRRLTVLTLLPTGCQAVTGSSIKWRVEERRCVLLTVTTLWKSHLILLSCINVLNQLASLAWACVCWGWLFILFSVTYIRDLISTTDRQPKEHTVGNKCGLLRASAGGCNQYIQYMYSRSDSPALKHIDKQTLVTCCKYIYPVHILIQYLLFWNTPDMTKWQRYKPRKRHYPKSTSTANSI